MEGDASNWCCRDGADEASCREGEGTVRMGGTQLDTEVEELEGTVEQDW